MFYELSLFVLCGDSCRVPECAGYSPVELPMNLYEVPKCPEKAVKLGRLSANITATYTYPLRFNASLNRFISMKVALSTRRSRGWAFCEEDFQKI